MPLIDSAPARSAAPKFVTRNMDAERSAEAEGPVYVYTFQWQGKQYEIDDFGCLIRIDGHNFNHRLEASHPLLAAFERAASRCERAFWQKHFGPKTHA